LSDVGQGECRKDSGRGAYLARKQEAHPENAEAIDGEKRGRAPHAAEIVDGQARGVRAADLAMGNGDAFWVIAGARGRREHGDVIERSGRFRCTLTAARLDRRSFRKRLEREPSPGLQRRLLAEDELTAA